MVRLGLPIFTRRAITRPASLVAEQVKRTGEITDTDLSVHGIRISLACELTCQRALFRCLASETRVSLPSCRHFYGALE